PANPRISLCSTETRSTRRWITWPGRRYGRRGSLAATCSQVSPVPEPEGPTEETVGGTAAIARTSGSSSRRCSSYPRATRPPSSRAFIPLTQHDVGRAVPAGNEDEQRCPLVTYRPPRRCPSTVRHSHRRAG